MNARFVVADAGPLIAWAVGAVLSAALQMLGGLLVPEAVLKECTTDPSAPGAQRISDAAALGRLDVIPASRMAQLDSAFAHGLGGGETAVLAYAAQHGLLTLLDDRRARRIAQRLQLAVIGSAAVLAKLKLQAHIASVKPVLELWRRHGYFVSAAVPQDILIQAGEAAVTKSVQGF